MSWAVNRTCDIKLIMIKEVQSSEFLMDKEKAMVTNMVRRKSRTSAYYG